VIVAGSVEEFFQDLPGDQMIDVLLQDIGLPGVSGLEGIRAVKEKLPSTQVIMFSVYDDSNRIFKALCAGASGYLLKNTRLEDIKKSILSVHDGQAAMSPAIAKKVIAYFQPKKPESPLTEKEQLVVQLLTDGLSYKMIAEKMQISINTVGTHIRNIYKKLQVNSKAEVISKKMRGDI
jgi:DNA-binding NarL/FixJ family response regulator